MASRFLEGLGSQLLLEFRTRWYFYISSVIAALIIRVLPSTGIVITSPFTLMVAAVLVVPLIGGVLAAGRFFGLMIQSTLQVVFYNRKHKPEESIDPDLRKLAATYGSSSVSLSNGGSGITMNLSGLAGLWIFGLVGRSSSPYMSSGRTLPGKARPCQPSSVWASVRIVKMVRKQKWENIDSAGRSRS